MWNAATNCGIAVIAMRRAIVGADDAADARGRRRSGPRSTRRRARQHAQVVTIGDRHADHAVAVAAARALRARQAAQREDEQHAGGEIEQGGDVGFMVAPSGLLIVGPLQESDRVPGGIIDVQEDAAPRLDFRRPMRLNAGAGQHCYGARPRPRSRTQLQ